MTSTPATGYFNGAITNQNAKDAQDDMLEVLRELLGGNTESELTIATGSVTPTAGCHNIDTEGDAGTDDLANIIQTNHPDGRVLLIRANNTGRTVVVKHAATGVGEIILSDASDLSLDETYKWLLLKRTGTQWIELFRSHPNLEDLADVSITSYQIYDFLRWGGAAWVDQAVDVNNKTGAYTAVATDHWRPIHATAGSWTLSLTAAATLGSGWVLPFRNDSSSVITIDPNGAETIDGLTTIIVRPGQSMFIMCDGVNFYTFGRTSAGRQTIWVPASAMIPESTAGMVLTTYEPGSAIYKALVCDPDADSFAQFNVQMPKGWDEGPIIAQYLWAHPAATTYVVSWTLATKAEGNSDTLTGAFSGAVQTDDTGGTTDDLFISAESPASTPAGAAAGDLVSFRISRNADHGNDTLDVDAYLLGVSIFYNVDQGSDD